MKRILTGLAALVLAWAMTAGAQAAELAVESKSCLLMEKTTGQVLYAVNEHEPLEPASVTKVMTILLTMEAIDSGSLSYDDTVTASAYACSMGGSQIWLKENEQLTVEDMLKAVCVVSANDASVALAEHLAGSAEAFVEQMNSAPSVGKLAAQVVNDKFSFIERDDSNITRCTVCGWWRSFVDELESVRLVARCVVQHSVERIENWIESQVGPSLAVILNTLGWPHLFELAHAAAGRLSARQLSLISDYNALQAARLQAAVS